MFKRVGITGRLLMARLIGRPLPGSGAFGAPADPGVLPYLPEPEIAQNGEDDDDGSDQPDNVVHGHRVFLIMGRRAATVGMQRPAAAMVASPAILPGGAWLQPFSSPGQQPRELLRDRLVMSRSNQTLSRVCTDTAPGIRSV